MRLGQQPGWQRRTRVAGCWTVGATQFEFKRLGIVVRFGLYNWSPTVHVIAFKHTNDSTICMMHMMHERWTLNVWTPIFRLWWSLYFYHQAEVLLFEPLFTRFSLLFKLAPLDWQTSQCHCTEVQWYHTFHVYDNKGIQWIKAARIKSLCIAQSICIPGFWKKKLWVHSSTLRPTSFPVLYSHSQVATPLAIAKDHHGEYSFPLLH